MSIRTYAIFNQTIWNHVAERAGNEVASRSCLTQLPQARARAASAKESHSTISVMEKKRTTIVVMISGKWLGLK